MNMHGILFQKSKKKTIETPSSKAHSTHCLQVEHIFGLQFSFVDVNRNCVKCFLPVSFVCYFSILVIEGEKMCEICWVG